MKIYDSEKRIVRDATKEEIKQFDKNVELTKPDKKEQVNALKEELGTYDYIGTKIAMGVATIEDYAKEIAYTETLREQIRQLESEV